MAKAGADLVVSQCHSVIMGTEIKMTVHLLCKQVHFSLVQGLPCVLGCETTSTDVIIFPAFPFTCWPAQKRHSHLFLVLRVISCDFCQSTGVLKIYGAEYLPTIVLQQRTRGKYSQSQRLNPLPSLRYLIIGRSEDKTTVCLHSFTQMDLEITTLTLQGCFFAD